jgi:Mrp family chromosome partitioning ATPase
MLPIPYPELDVIFRQTVGKGARSICITAANSGEGVSSLALALAHLGAAAGLATVLVDLNLARPSTSVALGVERTRWSPADDSVRSAVTCAPRAGLGILPAPAGADPLAFRDPVKLRRVFEVDLAGYDLIVVDAAPVASMPGNAIPAEAIAAACRATLMVVLTGVTSAHAVRTAAERLIAAGATVYGAVFNDRFNPCLADELCREVDRIAAIAPRLSAWLRRRILNSTILNLQI